MEAQIAALEEEVAILKGEIKSVLQEMRTAILASENPFTGGSLSRGPAPAAASEPSAEPRVIQLPSAPGGYVPPAAHQSAPAASAPAPWTPGEPAPAAHHETEEDTDSYGAANATERAAPRALAPRSASGPAREHAPQPSGTQGPAALSRLPAPGVRALASLLTWVEETRERLDDRRYRVVLGLARYGDLIDDELEKTLLEAAKTVGGAAAGTRASTNDSIVALRQLEAILAPDSNVRRLSDFGAEAIERDSYGRASREARPSRRQ